MASLDRGPGAVDCRPCSQGSRQGQGHELSEDPWSWASGWGLGALCSSRHPPPTLPHLHHQQMPGPGSPILRTCKPLPPGWGTPLASVGDRGGGPGMGGFPLYIPCITNPQVFSLVLFLF